MTFDRQGFTNILNQMKQLPRDKWLDYVQNLYQSRNENFTESKSQAMQMINSKNPALNQFASLMSNQFGIKF